MRLTSGRSSPPTTTPRTKSSRRSWLRTRTGGDDRVQPPACPGHPDILPAGTSVLLTRVLSTDAGQARFPQLDRLQRTGEDRLTRVFPDCAGVHTAPRPAANASRVRRRWGVVSSRFPTAGLSRCPLPDARYPMSVTRCPLPDAVVGVGLDAQVATPRRQVADVAAAPDTGGTHTDLVGSWRELHVVAAVALARSPSRPSVNDYG